MLKINQNNYFNFIIFLTISIYSLVIINSSIEIFNKENISAKNILFRGEFIQWLKSSISSSGRFVPFSNTFNILLYKFTDNIKYYVVLKIFLILLNFFILKKIFDYLKITKYFIYAVIIICYNHSFLNSQYITTAEGDLGLLLTILFYIDLKRSHKQTNVYEFFLIIFLMIFLLGIKESMLGFFIFYVFLKILFFKNESLIIKLSYIIILILYLYSYYNFSFVHLDYDNIYSVDNSETNKFFSILKISLNYILTFPFIFYLFILVLNQFIKNLFLSKFTLSIKEIYFISVFGYLFVYIILNLLAFRYVFPLLFIIVPLFFTIYDKIDKKKPLIIIGILIFIFGPGYSNTIELVNNFSNKNYNRTLNNKLVNLKTQNDISIIYNWETKNYSLKGQKHDRNDLGNLLLHFEDRKNLKINFFFINNENFNFKFLNDEIIISSIRKNKRLQEQIINSFDAKIFNKFVYKKNCREPSLIKNLIIGANCAELITTLYLKQ
jgi:hypothetical protein